MSGEGDAGASFRVATGIDRGGVEVVHTMFKGVVDFLVDHLLVDLGVGVVAEGGSVDHRETHHAVAQQRDFVASVWVGAISHLALSINDIDRDDIVCIV